MVDDEDYDRVSRYRWCMTKRGYAITNIPEEAIDYRNAFRKP